METSCRTMLPTCLLRVVTWWRHTMRRGTRVPPRSRRWPMTTTTWWRHTMRRGARVPPRSRRWPMTTTTWTAAARTYVWTERMIRCVAHSARALFCLLGRVLRQRCMVQRAEIVAAAARLVAPEITFAQLAEATEGFSNKIGDGATGEVYSGTLGGVPVAVKRLRLPEGATPEQQQQLRRQYRAEVDVLSRYRHGRIVRLLGFAEAPAGDAGAHPFALVFEFLDGGSLADWLRSPTGSPPARPRTGELPVSALARIDIALGAAAGLAFLHGNRVLGDGEGAPEEPVMHRDVKSANIGLAVQRGGALFSKLVDCGLAKVVRGRAVGGGRAGAGGVSMTGGFAAGTPGYMAPELTMGVYSPLSEVFSFGMVLIELLMGRRIEPLTGYTVAREVKAGGGGVGPLVARAEVGVWPRDAAEALARLALDCIHLDDYERPAGIAVVIERIQAVRALVDVDDATPLRRCAICLEEVPVAAGVVCTGDHFVCDDSLSQLVRMHLEPVRMKEGRGRVPCPTVGCGVRWQIEDIEAHVDRGAIIEYGRAMRYLLFDAPDARRASAEALAAREAAARDARVAFDERVRQHRAVIAERDLLLRCPHCAAPFDEYDGCNALTCRRCGCGFCAVCLEDCGRDAHRHYREAHPGSVSNRHLFETAQRDRRTALVIAALRGLRGEGAAMQGAVLNELAKADLRDLGIAVGPVREAMAHGDDPAHADARVAAVVNVCSALALCLTAKRSSDAMLGVMCAARCRRRCWRRRRRRWRRRRR